MASKRGQQDCSGISVAAGADAERFPHRIPQPLDLGAARAVAGWSVAHMTVAIASVAVITAIDARIMGRLTPVADVVSGSFV
jgi:hypothetical protein